MTTFLVIGGIFLAAAYGFFILWFGFLLLHGFYHAGVLGFPCDGCGRLIGRDDGPQEVNGIGVVCQECSVKYGRLGK